MTLRPKRQKTNVSYKPIHLENARREKLDAWMKVGRERPPIIRSFIAFYWSFLETFGYIIKF